MQDKKLYFWGVKVGNFHQKPKKFKMSNLLEIKI